MSLTLARELATRGHRVTVLTRTAGPPTGEPFRVVRKVSWRAALRLVREADVVHSNGSSLALFLHAQATRTPFVWTHQGYQLVCIDGLGWDEDVEMPLSPLASVRFHLRMHGVRAGMRGAIKLAIRRWAARCVAANVAVTDWVATRQPLRRQLVIYNPFPLTQFAGARRDVTPDFDLLFVGRLVSEKGAHVLLRALSILRSSSPSSRLTLAIVGDGPQRAALEESTRASQLEDAVIFCGSLQGAALIDVIERSRFAVVPSVWEEAMGGVALELLAAGKPLIVSRRGGMAECVGDAALLTENGDAEMLAERIRLLLTDDALRQRLTRAASAVVGRFAESQLVDRYEELYRSIVACRA